MTGFCSSLGWFVASVISSAEDRSDLETGSSEHSLPCQTAEKTGEARGFSGAPQQGWKGGHSVWAVNCWENLVKQPVSHSS